MHFEKNKLVCKEGEVEINRKRLSNSYVASLRLCCDKSISIRTQLFFLILCPKHYHLDDPIMELATTKKGFLVVFRSTDRVICYECGEYSLEGFLCKNCKELFIETIRRTDLEVFVENAET